MSGGLGWSSSPSVKMGMQSLIFHSLKNNVLTYSHAWHFQITSNQFKLPVSMHFKRSN